MVWRFDRAGRSTPDLLALAAGLQRRGGELVSLTEQIDTSTPGGKVLFTVMAALAQFEADLTSEWTKEAWRAKKANGMPRGRRSAFHDPENVRTAKALLETGAFTKAEIAARVGVSVSTLYCRFPGGDPEAFDGNYRRRAA